MKFLPLRISLGHAKKTPPKSNTKLSKNAKLPDYHNLLKEKLQILTSDS